MTDQNVSLDFHVATGIEEAVSDLEVCRSLMNLALQFSYTNAEEVGLAQSQLFFLVKSLGAVEERLGKIQAVAYGQDNAARVAA